MVLCAVMTPFDASQVYAQSPATTDVEIAVVGAGLLALRPVDDFYVGDPYLSDGLGGVALGAGGALHLRARAFVLAFEAGTASHEVVQTGRLVGGRAISHLRETMISGMGGVSAGSPPRRIQVLVGISRVFGDPKVNGVPIDNATVKQFNPSLLEGAGTIAPTLGGDWYSAVSNRLAVIGGVRYWRLPRSRRAEEIGVGRDAFRIGVGLRVAVKAAS